MLNAIYLSHIPLTDSPSWRYTCHNENPAYSVKEFPCGNVAGLLLVDDETLALLQTRKLQCSRLEAMCRSDYKLTVRAFGSATSPLPDAHSLHFVFLRDLGIFSITAFYLYPGLKVFAVTKRENIYCIPEADPGIDEVMNIIKSGKSNIDEFICSSFRSLGRRDLKNITAKKSIIKWAGPLPGVAPALIEKGDIIYLNELNMAVVRDIAKADGDFYLALENGYGSYIRRYPKDSEVVIIKGKAKQRSIRWFEKTDTSYLEEIGNEHAAVSSVNVGDVLSFPDKRATVLLAYTGIRDNILHLILKADDGVFYRAFEADSFKVEIFRNNFSCARL